MRADGAGSRIEVPAGLSARFRYGNSWNGFIATNGGRILITAIEAMSGGVIQFTGANSFVDLGTNPGVPVVGASPGQLGPVSYRSFQDSPFREVPFTSFLLEDGEDGAINTPGISFTNHRSGGSAWGVRSASATTDSVDGDDGNIDGQGSAGKSLAPVTNDGSEGDGVTVSFSAAVLGYLPTHAGFVVTDSSPDKPVLVEFFDGAGRQIGSAGPALLADATANGSTADDYFFGAVHRAGIGSFRVRALGGTGTLELDHLQYGSTQGAQTPVATRFAADLKLVRGGPVAAALRTADGSIFAGGTFTKANGAAHAGLVKLAADGSVAAGWSTPAMVPVNQDAAVVNAFASDATRLFAGGDFAFTVSNQEKRYLRAIVPGSGAQGTALSAQPDAPVVSLATGTNVLFAATAGKVFRYDTTPTAVNLVSWNGLPQWLDAGERIEAIMALDSHVYVAGRFDSLQGKPRTHLARINASNGAVDLTWNPVLPAAWHIEQLLTDGNDLFLRAKDLGQPDTLGSVLRKVSVSSATLDATWQAGTAMPVATCAISGPHLYLAGRDGSMKRLALASGALDGAWSQGLTGHATALAAAADGLLAFGPFRSAGSSSALGAVKLDLATGAKSAGFNASLLSPGTILTLARQTDGKILAGGDFQEIQGKPVMNFARLEAGTDRFDPAWAPAFRGGSVRVIDVSGSDIHVGGDFILADSLPVSLARFAPYADAGPDPAFVPAVSGVGALLVTPEWIYAGGRFPAAAGDVHLRRLPRRGDGSADATWGPLLRNDSAAVRIKTLAMDEGFVYLGGEFTVVDGVGRTALARVDLDRGNVSTKWNPTVFRSAPGVASVEKLVLRDAHAYFAGAFTHVQGKPQNHLARITIAEGDFDTGWKPVVAAPLNALVFAGTGILTGGKDLLFYQTGSPLTPARVLATTDGPLRQILPDGERVLMAGGFSTLGGAAAAGYGAAAFTGQVRVVFSGRFVHIYPDDSTGAYANGFKLDSITGGRLADPTTGLFYTSGATLTLAQGISGLLWLRDPAATSQGLTVSANAGTSASDLNPTPVGPAELPGYAFSTGSITVMEGSVLSALPELSGLIQYRGTAQIGSVAYEVIPATAQPFDGNSGDYLDAPVPVSFRHNPQRGVFEGQLPIPILADNVAEAAEDFYVRLVNPTGGIPLGRNTLLKVTVTDNPAGPTGAAAIHPQLRQLTPTLGLSSGTSLTVNLGPAAAQGMWRLWDETFWRPSGSTATNLQAGRHRVEYKPADGYRALLTPDSIQINEGQAAVLNATYVLDPELLLDGKVTVRIFPEALAAAALEAERGQWRFTGESIWRNTTAAASATPGKHMVEFKEGITGWIAPAPRFIEVGPDGQVTLRASYRPDGSGAAPVSLPFSGSGSIQDGPNQYVGQIESNFGHATGTVVSEQVVLTAARALWNPETLGIATRVAWFHQQSSASQKVVPRGPRNVLILSGYAAERAEDEAEGTDPAGTGALASDNRDAAVMYFIGNAAANMPARGGFSGYLADFSRSPGFAPWLAGTHSRTLCGYPVSGVPALDRGLMHATAASTAPFVRLQNQVYRSAAFEGRPGMEGGPLFVQHPDGTRYPAAIYLGENGGAVFRAIDLQLVQLIYRAEAIANLLSTGITGGGNEFVNTLTGDDDAPSGFVSASLVPGQGRWRLLDSDTGLPVTDWFLNGNVAMLVADRYLIEYEPIGGLVTPPPTPVLALGGQTAPPVSIYYPFPIRYEDWKAEAFTAAQQANAAISGPDANPDGDRFENRSEFGLGLSPFSRTVRPADAVAKQPGLPRMDIVPGSQPVARYSFLRRHRTPVLDIDYQIELSSSPSGPWMPSTQPVEYESVDQYWESMSISLPLQSERRKHFARLRIIPKTPAP